MEQRTTIQIPRPLVARLKKAATKEQTYADIIAEALKALERQRMQDLHWKIAQDVMSGKEPYRTL